MKSRISGSDTLVTTRGDFRHSKADYPGQHPVALVRDARSVKARNWSSRVALAAVCRLRPLLPDAHVVRFDLDKVAQKCPTASGVLLVFQRYLLQPPQLLEYLRWSLFSKANYLVTPPPHHHWLFGEVIAHSRRLRGGKTNWLDVRVESDLSVLRTLVDCFFLWTLDESLTPSRGTSKHSQHRNLSPSALILHLCLDCAHHPPTDYHFTNVAFVLTKT